MCWLCDVRYPSKEAQDDLRNCVELNGLQSPGFDAAAIRVLFGAMINPAARPESGMEVQGSGCQLFISWVSDKANVSCNLNRDDSGIEFLMCAGISTEQERRMVPPEHVTGGARQARRLMSINERGLQASTMTV